MKKLFLISSIVLVWIYVPSPETSSAAEPVVVTIKAPDSVVIKMRVLDARLTELKHVPRHEKK